MRKEVLEKNYFTWEEEFKKKLLIYMNYTLGAMCLLEGIASCQVYIIYYNIYVEFGQNILLGTFPLLLLPSLGLLWIKTIPKIFFIRHRSLSECKLSSYRMFYYSINQT